MRPLHRLALAGIAAITLLPAPANASSGDPTGFGCEGVLALLPAPAANVLPLVEPAFQPYVVQASGNATVFAASEACDEMRRGARSTPDSAYAIVGVALSAPDGTDGTHFYLLSWTSNDPNLVSWLKAGTGLGDRAQLSEHLSFSLATIDGGVGPDMWDWSFTSPSPSPDAFAVEASAIEPAAEPGGHAVFWRGTEGGTLRIQTVPVREAFGPASGTLDPSGTSELAAALGGEEPRAFGGLSILIGEGSLSKQILESD